MTRIGGLVTLLLLGCGGAGAGGGTTPGHGPTYTVMDARRIAVGTSWDEEVSFVRSRRTVTHVLGNQSVEVAETRVDLLAHVEVVDTSTVGGLARFVIRRANVTDANGPRPLLAPGDELSVIGGLTPHVSSPAGPMPDDVLSHLRHVVAVPSLGATTLTEAERALGPPDGRAAVGQRWEMNHMAVEHFFVRGAPGVVVPVDAFEAFGELGDVSAVDGHECLAMRTTLFIHDMTVPGLPPGTIVDDFELEVHAEAAWPTDLALPEPSEHYHTAMTSQMHAFSEAGVRVDITASETEERTRTRTAITAP